MAETHPTDVRAALKEAMARLRAGRVPSHTLAAELLLMHVLGRDRTWLYAHPEEVLSLRDVERYFVLLAKRVAGVPTQYLTGRQEFWGLEFEVGPGVLIPRPETEHVVEVALARLGPPHADNPLPRGAGLHVADVCTGSGCIAVALARELPGARVHATDISAAALAYARRNAVRHGVISQVDFVQCSFLGAFRGAALLDIVISNPPYVGRDELASLPEDVRAHEPLGALCGGEHGHEIYAPLLADARRMLRAGGLFVVELSYNALARVEPLLDSPHWTDVTVTHDLAGIPRVLAATRTRN